MSYRQSKVISRDLIEKSMDSINPHILGLGLHLVEIESVIDTGGTLTIQFKNTNTKIVCNYDSFLYNSLMAAAAYKDRDLLWELKDSRQHDLLTKIQVKVLVDIGWGHTLIKQDDNYIIVNTKDGSIVTEFDNYTDAKASRDVLGRAWLNITKCYPTKREVIKSSNDHLKNILGELHGRK